MPSHVSLPGFLCSKSLSSSLLVLGSTFFCSIFYFFCSLWMGINSCILQMRKQRCRFGDLLNRNTACNVRAGKLTKSTWLQSHAPFFHFTFMHMCSMCVCVCVCVCVCACVYDLPKVLGGLFTGLFPFPLSLPPSFLPLPLPLVSLPSG